MKILERIVERARKKPARIVFPESEDERVIKAVERVAKEGVAYPVVVGEKNTIREKINEKSNLQDVRLVQPGFDNPDYIAFMREKLGKEASQYIRDKVYYGLYLMEKGEADALISGANHTTAHTVRAALKMIGVRKDVKRISSYFIMAKEDKYYLFADCAINITPNERELAEIAYLTSLSASELGIQGKRIAFVSFSTKGSAQHPILDKIRKAVSLAKKQIKDGIIDGELQIDAAIVPEVARKKCPDSPIKGKANVLIFPDLQSGNIAYKIAQRFGGYKAVGPIIQGLNKPVNDLSRGCSEEDIFYVSAITSQQVARRN